MKKIYSAPAMAVTNIQIEGMIAASDLESIKLGTTSGNSQLSDKKGWDSENWSSMDEE
ncbi:MAG: hypothetical protein ACI353_00575 [Alloprevotella sp.]